MLTRRAEAGDRRRRGSQTWEWGGLEQGVWTGARYTGGTGSTGKEGFLGVTALTYDCTLGHLL